MKTVLKPGEFGKDRSELRAPVYLSAGSGTKRRVEVDVGAKPGVVLQQFFKGAKKAKGE